MRLNVRDKTVQEMYGGACDGNPTFEESCNLQECPGILSLFLSLFHSIIIFLSYLISSNANYR